MQVSNLMQERGQVDFFGAVDIAYVNRRKEGWWDEREDKKVFFRDMAERKDNETSESGEKARVSVEEMSSDGAIDVV